MAVQLPGAGTPIDATLLGSYALEINRLAGTVANSTKMSTVNPPPLSQQSGTKRSVITSELSFWAGYVDISYVASSSNSKPAEVVFDSVFAQTPIVVATPYSQNSSNPADVSVTQISCSTSKAIFNVKYGGNFSGFLNVIAIGISTKL